MSLLKSIHVVSWFILAIRNVLSLSDNPSFIMDKDTKYNNFYFLQNLITKDKYNAIDFMNSLGKKNFCRVMFTNAIFAVLDIIDDLNHCKLLYCIERSISKGYTYFLNTICENSVVFTSLFFSESYMPPDSNVTLSSFGEYYNIFVNVEHRKICNTKNIKIMKLNYMGRMSLDDLPGHVEDDPSATDKRHSIDYLYEVLLFFNKDDDQFKKELRNIFYTKKTTDINIQDLYNRYLNKRNSKQLKLQKLTPENVRKILEISKIYNVKEDTCWSSSVG